LVVEIINVYHSQISILEMDIYYINEIKFHKLKGLNYQIRVSYGSYTQSTTCDIKQLELLPIKIVWLRYHILKLDLKIKMKIYFQNLGDAFGLLQSSKCSK
jgi:hypothetical protein